MNIKEYWHQLNSREQTITSIGGACAIFYLFYLLFYAPFVNSIHNKQVEFLDKQETLHWMQQQQKQPIGKKRQSINNAQLLTMITKELTNSPFHAFSYQLQQTNTNEIQLSYEQLPFNEFLLWLWSFSNRYAFTIKQMIVQPTKTAGVVKLQLMLIPIP